MAIGVAAAGAASGSLLGSFFGRQGKTLSDKIREREKQAIEDSRRALTKANQQAGARLDNTLASISNTFSQSIQSGNNALRAFNETLGLTQTVDQKQQVLEDVLSNKTDVRELTNIFDFIDPEELSKQFVTPGKISRTYDQEYLDTGSLSVAKLLGFFGGDTYGGSLDGIKTLQDIKDANDPRLDKFVKTRKVTEQIDDPNFQKGTVESLQAEITRQALAKGLLDPFDERTPLEKYQGTAQYGILQDEIAQAQQALSRQAAGSGLLASGNLGLALQERGTQLANRGFLDYQNQLLAGANQGAQAQGQLANAQLQIGQSQAELLRQQGVDESNLNFLNAASGANFVSGKATSLFGN